MPCVHVIKLYQLCEEQGIKLGSSDVIHIVCKKCNEKEVCPSVLTDEYDATVGEETLAEEPADSSAPNPQMTRRPR